MIHTGGKKPTKKHAIYVDCIGNLENINTVTKMLIVRAESIVSMHFKMGN